MDDDLFEVVLGARARHTPGPADAAFIDLTEDPDSPPARAPQRPRHATGPFNHAARGRSHPAHDTHPQGNRASTPVIDLTGDEPSPEPRDTQQHHRDVGLEPEGLDDIIILRNIHHVPRPPRRPPPRNRPRLTSTFAPTVRSFLGVHLFPGLGPPPNLDYQHPAFEPQPPPPPPAAAAQQEDRGAKMEVAPAREGFSRDTAEEMVVVCPACGGELEYDPGKSGAKKRKNQKEHHFWAVKACGHVRCASHSLPLEFRSLRSCLPLLLPLTPNAFLRRPLRFGRSQWLTSSGKQVYCQQCFENRKTTAKNQSKFRALDGSVPPAPRAGVLCAVDECKAEVTGKTAWVGIYL